MSKKEASDKIYNESIIEKTIFISFQHVGNNLKQYLEEKIKKIYENKCCEEGFIKEDTIQLISYSAGLLQGNDVRFNIVFSCMICLPVQNMIIDCFVESITKAGVKGIVTKTEKNPIVIFIARDHHYNVSAFGTIKENDKIKVKVIGQRFELHDDFITVIAELI